MIGAVILAAAATALETAAGAGTTTNATRSGYWKRIAVALEALAGAGTTTNATISGYMTRAAVAVESIAGTSGAGENANHEGLLKRVVDGLEVQAGAVTSGSLAGRFGVAAANATFGYDSAATTYFAAMSVQPNDTRKGLLNTLIVGLKADGVWALLDWISFLAAHDEQAARINAKNPAQVATAVAVPVFTVDRGFAGIAGLTAYLDTGVTNTAAGNSVQDNSCVFGWANAIGALGGPLVGTLTAAAQRLYFATGVDRSYRVQGTAAPLIVATAPTTGLYSGSRSTASEVRGYKNGVLDGTASAATSAAPTAVNLTFLRGAGVSSDHRIAAGGWGGALDATKQTALYDRLNTYLTAVGGA